MKNSEIVSKITNTLKLNNRDNRLSRRYVLRLLRDSAQQLISTKLLDRTIFSELNLYTEINCFEFKKVDAIKCPMIEFRKCEVLMKSKNPLPRLVFSRLGASIKEIVSLDGNYKFTFIDKAQYQRNKKRQVKLKNETYIYLGADNHLYIPDEEIYSVDLTVLTVEPESVVSCIKDECKNNWKAEFICPDKLIDVVLSQTLQVLGMSKQVREDSNPDNIEGN
jgi:hypothetical protein